MDFLETREAIASLPGHLGYQALLKTLEDIVEAAVISTVQATTEAETLKAARNLQALFKYHTVLKTVPQNIQQEFEQEQQAIRELGEDVYLSPQRRQLLQSIESNYDPDTGSPKKKKK